LTWVSFATVSDLDQHVQVREGHWPAVAGDGDPGVPAGDSIVEVLVHERVALDFGWQVGETYLARHGDVQVPIRIAGTWAPLDARAKFWSAPLEELALVPEQTFAGRLSPYLGGEVYLGVWQVVADGGGLHAGDVAPLLARVETLQERSEARLPRVVLDDSPVEPLQVYQRGVPGLTFLLFAFSVPILGLLLAFIGLVVGLYVAGQRNQIAVLRSRGATRWQVVGIAALEGLLLGALALLVGSPLGVLIAWLIGRARSFLNFTAPPELRVGLTWQTLAVGAVAVGLALVAQLLPTWSAAGHTIVTYKREQARALRPPWWQRAWLDGLLLLPTAYGFYILRQQGSLAAAGGTAVHDLFQDPLLFLTPSLGLFALTLFLVRLLPLVMRAAAWLAARTNSVGLLLASRQLSRAPGRFSAPLMLLTLTLSLSAFTASLAQTLDGHLSKQMYYKAGADLRLAEVGLSTGVVAGGSGPRWLFRPLESHLQVPGVLAVTRVGRYPVVVLSNPAPTSGVFVGLDRLEFPRVAYWQPDLAPASLGGLMNELALSPDGVLVTRDFLAAQGLRVGDFVNLIVTAYDEPTNLMLKIVGALDLFPTWYPGDGPLFVGDLEPFFTQAGRVYPYEVWFKTHPNADQRRIVATVRGLTALLDPGVDPAGVVEDGLNVVVTDWESAPLEILAQQRRPERQGLFGLLSVGFIASALLTVLGFFLYALASFRRRFIELGVLRAVGLSLKQMTVLLAWELAALILVGMAAGTALGVCVSAWFIPYLQVGVEASSHYPPFVVAIAWPAILRIYLLFALLFLAALAGLTTLLLRMKIFQAVKLGETV